MRKIRTISDFICTRSVLYLRVHRTKSVDCTISARTSDYFRAYIRTISVLYRTKSVLYPYIGLYPRVHRTLSARTSGFISSYIARTSDFIAAYIARTSRVHPDPRTYASPPSIANPALMTTLPPLFCVLSSSSCLPDQIHVPSRCAQLTHRLGSDVVAKIAVRMLLLERV